MPKIRMKSARTTEASDIAAVEQLLTQIEGMSPKLVTLFASFDRDHRNLNKLLRERLPSTTRLIGATSGGEIDQEGIHKRSIVLGALDGDFDVGLGLGKGLSTDAISAGVQAVGQACSELGIRTNDLDARKNVGLVIDDGAKMKKEELLLGMLEKNQSLVLVGGGASDLAILPTEQKALIHVDGEVVDDAALIALFSTNVPWAAMRSHWYEPTGQTLTITKVDDTHTRALEINGRPAAPVYAELLGVGVDELTFGMPKGFASQPTALRVGREYFIRAPGMPLPDGSILFVNLLEEGTELELMKTGDMGALTRRFFAEEIPKRVPSPSAAIFFHCGGRRWIAESTGMLGEVSDAFHAAPTCVGFNVNFEIYCGFHINTTLTALVFGESP